MNFEVSAMNSRNNADELSQVSSINCSGPCCKLFAFLCLKTKPTGTLHRNLFLFMDWLSKSEVQSGYHIVPSERAYGYLLCVFIVVLEQ